MPVLPPIPSTEGRSYEILEPVNGRGEDGRVFRARLTGSAGFAKIIAIKMLDDSSRRGEPAQRLRDEARLLALLRHRAIVQVDDLVELDGRWAVVMEFVDGQDLTTLLRGGPIPGRPLAEIGVELASALAAAHDGRDPASGAPLNLVHRDVQPGNVKVTPQGQVMLLGFGLARAKFAGREARTGFLSVGSAGFLAPERLVGVDSAAGDVYGLAATLAAAALGESQMKPWSPTQAAHASGLTELKTRVARALGGTAGEAFADRIAAAMVYSAEARPTARQLENELQDLVASLEGPWLRRWAPERVTPYAPPPPAPSVPSTEEGPSTAALVVEAMEGSRPPPPATPAPQTTSRPPPSRPPTTRPPPEKPTPTEQPEQPPSRPLRVALLALVVGFGAVLLVTVLGVALILLYLRG